MQENLKTQNTFEPSRDPRNTYAIHETREKRRRLMIIGASCGLILCLTALAIFKKEMSEEVIGILYMITGIFGACLTEAYDFEFRLFRPKSRKTKQREYRLRELPGQIASGGSIKFTDFKVCREITKDDSDRSGI